MDIRHHLNILLRWRIVLAGGLILAALLAILVTFSVSPGGVQWRSEASYTSTSRTFVTQPGFPVGRATLPGANPNETIDPENPPARTFAPPERFTELAVVYSYLAQSDQVRRLMTPAPVNEQIDVVTVPSPATGDPLPLLEIATTAHTPAGAQALNRAVIDALRDYLNQNVEANRVPRDERVALEVLNPPKVGGLVAGRSITLSVIVLLLTIVATLVAVYVLENLYPSRRAVEPLAENGEKRGFLELNELGYWIARTPEPDNGHTGNGADSERDPEDDRRGHRAA